MAGFFPIVVRGIKDFDDGFFESALKADDINVNVYAVDVHILGSSTAEFKIHESAESGVVCTLTLTGNIPTINNLIDLKLKQLAEEEVIARLEEEHNRAIIDQAKVIAKREGVYTPHGSSAEVTAVKWNSKPVDINTLLDLVQHHVTDDDDRNTLTMAIRNKMSGLDTALFA